MSEVPTLPTPKLPVFRNSEKSAFKYMCFMQSLNGEFRECVSGDAVASHGVHFERSYIYIYIYI